MDPITLTVISTVVAFFVFRKKKPTSPKVEVDTDLFLFTVSNTTPPVIKEAGSATATAPSGATVVLSLPNDWRGTASFQGILWEEQGSPDGPDFMFRRDPDWSGEAYFTVAVRNSYGQQSGNVTVNLA